MVWVGGICSVLLAESLFVTCLRHVEGVEVIGLEECGDMEVGSVDDA